MWTSQDLIYVAVKDLVNVDSTGFSLRGSEGFSSYGQCKVKLIFPVLYHVAVVLYYRWQHLCIMLLQSCTIAGSQVSSLYHVAVVLHCRWQPGLISVSCYCSPVLSLVARSHHCIMLLQSFTVAGSQVASLYHVAVVLYCRWQPGRCQPGRIYTFPPNLHFPFTTFY